MNELPNKIIEKSQQEVIIEAYQQWLQHPITNIMFQSLRKLKDDFAGKITNNCLEHEIHLRHFASCMKNTEAIIKTLSSQELFLNQLNVPKQ